MLQQGNAELQEDVVDKDALDRGTSDDGETDEQVAQSFPASDPPSDWSGPRGGGDPDEPLPHGEVVGRSPVPHVPGRTHPGQPVPGTLPRD